MNPNFETQIKAIQIADQMQQMLIPQINVINLITSLKLKSHMLRKSHRSLLIGGVSLLVSQ